MLSRRFVLCSVNNPLMRMLYEAETVQAPDNLVNIHNSLVVWRQRERVSVEDVVTQLTIIHQPSSHTPGRHKKLALLVEFFKEVLFHRHLSIFTAEFVIVSLATKLKILAAIVGTVAAKSMLSAQYCQTATAAAKTFLL